MQNLFSGGVFIHPSAYRHGGGLLRQVSAQRRPHGGVRYVCPVTGSFVLVTDPDALRLLERPHARLRCVGCGETHFIACTSAEEDEPVDIVAAAAKS